MKRRFITFVSHQLQSPLAAVHQYLDVLNHLGETGDPRVRQEWIDRCLQRTEEMRGLIQDWLTLARVEGGALSRDRVRVDLNPVIAGILNNYEGAAQAGQVRLEAALPQEGCAVRGDPNSVSVLFDNLISNAIKYNRPGGTVTVSGEIASGEVVIAVADSGIGIPEQDRRLVFDEFFRVRGEGRAGIPGSGLGLNIARRIVSEMGGTIAVESEPGAGSTFRVRLPAYRDAN
jgi:signal transduction histidine kinase